MRQRRRALLVGSLPPPANGMTLSTRALLDAAPRERFDLVHLDTSDHRDIKNVARIDLRNVLLAAKHGLQFIYLSVRHRPRIVYLPVARNRVGFLRDALFL